MGNKLLNMFKKKGIVTLKRAIGIKHQRRQRTRTHPKPIPRRKVIHRQPRVLGPKVKMPKVVVSKEAEWNKTVSAMTPEQRTKLATIVPLEWKAKTTPKQISRGRGGIVVKETMTPKEIAEWEHEHKEKLGPPIRVPKRGYWIMKDRYTGKEIHYPQYPNKTVYYDDERMWIMRGNERVYIDKPVKQKPILGPKVKMPQGREMSEREVNRLVKHYEKQVYSYSAQEDREFDEMIRRHEEQEVREAEKWQQQWDREEAERKRQAIKEFRKYLKPKK